MKWVVVFFIVFIFVKCGNSKANDLLDIPLNKLDLYSVKISNKFLEYSSPYLPYGAEDVIRAHPYLSATSIVIISALIAYAAYTTFTVASKAIAFIVQLDSFLNEGYATVNRDYIEKGDTSNMHSLSELKNLPETDRVKLVGVLKERLGLHPTFMSAVEYYSSAMYLCKAFNISWDSFSKAGNVDQIAELFAMGKS